MLNNLVKISAVLLLALGLCSCGEDKVDGIKWGETKVYDDFLWKSFEPDTLWRTLELDFNRDAKRFLQRPVKLSVCKKNEDGVFAVVNNSELQAFVDGKVCENNVLVIEPSLDSLRLGFVISSNVEDKSHFYYLKVVDAAGLERIQGLEPKEFNDDSVALQELVIEKGSKMNPLAKLLMWIGLIALSALFLWFLLFKRIVYPRMSKMKKTVKVMLNGETVGLFTAVFTGARRVYFAKEKVEQSWFSRIFTGEIKTVVIPSLVESIEFVPKNKWALAKGKGYMIIPNPMPQSGVVKITDNVNKIDIELK